MKVLLDECGDWRLARDIPGHDVRTVRQLGWKRLRNGELLDRAAKEFDVFVTVDRNLAFQQNADSLPITVVILHAQTNRLADLRPLVPALQEILESANRGGVTVIAAP